MDNQAEVRDFLRTRRARISPARANIIGGGTRRRVPGLRREEVAFLAGVSVDYYARMERGNLVGVSEEVLAALAAALGLDEAETSYLYDLARSARPQPAKRRRARRDTGVRPSLLRLLDSITRAPACIRNQRLDFVAGNPLGRALYAPVLEDPGSGGNNALYVFLNPGARVFYADWQQGADDVATTLRLHAGRNPRDKDLTDLIGELVTRSDEFRVRWAAHNVGFHRGGVKRLHHPAVGDLELAVETMELPESPGWTMFGYTAEPGSPTEDRLRLLGSLAVTQAGHGDPTDLSKHRE
ncbi:helix-turn-helix transcriptional regulator [Streptomyces sp. GMY02]|uniref:helix-turn-helix transcriptional regulator n=1 Tax=Streptomyces sp. GMY02 TaxID=1333528 RepID=UPI001C2B96D1|nr:helix-turn-helix transcriptional regulator [Streptomyces sp. GMY02]QXE38412.1 helix-turn-helix transcriptional regulator [Streptomyces sp. GMY02]